MNKVLKTNDVSTSKSGKNKLSIFNIITLTMSCISLILFLIGLVSFITLTEQYVQTSDKYGNTEFVYSINAHYLSITATIIMVTLLIPAITNIIIGILSSKKSIKNLEEKNQKLQKAIKIINLMGGLIFVNGILVLIMMWRNKKGIIPFLAVAAALPMAAVISSSVTSVTATQKISESLKLFKGASEKTMVKIDAKNKVVNVDLKTLSESLTDEMLKQKFLHEPEQMIIGGGTGSQGEITIIEAWAYTLKSVVDFQEVYKEEKNKTWNNGASEELHFSLNWNNSVKKIQITAAMNMAINAIIDIINPSKYDISFGNNSSLEEISGDLGSAFKAEKIILPNGVKENPFEK
ncbi:hypothetical protein [Mycoplasma todarodis]|uniref:hypothetical protein n=1 Tax=Mycoplasma todarodis TaxID=1937191 RepID=UPI003B32129E